MNRIYKVVWNAARNCYVVGSEFIGRKYKGGGYCSKDTTKRLKTLLAVCAACGMSLMGMGISTAADQGQDEGEIVIEMQAQKDALQPDTLYSQLALAAAGGQEASGTAAGVGSAGSSQADTPADGSSKQHIVYDRNGFYVYNGEEKDTYNSLTKEGLWVGGVSDTTGFHVDNEGHASANGLDVQGQKITGVADGDFTLGSKDAVTAGQLYAAGIVPGQTVSGSIAIGEGSDVAYANSIAIGKNADVNTAKSIVIGNDTESKGAGAVVIGHESAVSTNSPWSTAIGYQSKVVGGSEGYATAVGANSNAGKATATAIGAKSNAENYGAVAIGFSSQATGYESVAIGSSSKATMDSNVALGFKSEATGVYATALGKESQATATNSVALGNGSIADQDNTVSVGNDDLNRRIVNVADGVNDTDAATVGQIKDMTGLDTTKGNVVQYDGEDKSTVTFAGENGTALNNVSDIVINTKDSYGKDAQFSFQDAGLLPGDVQSFGNKWNMAIGEGSAVKVEDGTGSKMQMNTVIGNTARITQALVNGKYEDVEKSTALGQGVTVAASNAVGIGQGSNVRGEGGVAVGMQANVSAKSGVAIGKTSKVSSDYSVAVGGAASVGSKSENSVVMGYSAGSSSAGGTAIGQGAKVQGSAANGTAIGKGAIVNVNAGNSVALGANSQVRTDDIGEDTEYGVVSIGKSGDNGFTRRIVNVADGVNDTDAATVGQIKTMTGVDAELGGVVQYDGEDKTSVTFNHGNEAGSVLNNVNDIVMQVETYNTSGNVSSYKTLSFKDAGIVPGTVSGDDNTDSVVIGRDSKSSKKHSVVVGDGARTLGMNATAIGTGASAEMDSSVAIGSGSQVGTPSAVNGTAVGAGSKVTAKNGTAVGQGAYAWGTDSTVLGASARVERNADGSVALGKDSYAKASDILDSDTNGVVSVGKSGNNGFTRRIINVADGTIAKDSHDAVTGGQLYATNQNVADNADKLAAYENAGVVAGDVNGNEDNSVAIGTGSFVTGGAYKDGQPLPANGVAIGAGANVDREKVNGTAIGQGATVWANNGTAIGQGSRVNLDTDGSIALGQDSVVIKSDIKDTDVNGVVSVGSSQLQGNFTRRIINVADGRITASSNDAVTGKQLYATNQNVADNADKLAAYENAGVQAGTVADVNKTGSLALGEGSAVKADYDLAEDKGYATAIGGESVAGMNAATAIGGKSLADKSGAVAVGYNSQALAKNSISIGLNSKTEDLSDIAIGSDSRAAGSYSVALGKGSEATGYSSVALGHNSVASGDNTVSVGNDELKRRIVNVADGKSDTDAATVGQIKTMTGIDAEKGNVVQYDDESKGTITLAGEKGTKLTGLAAGTFAEDSTDAVTAGQLYDAGIVPGKAADGSVAIGNGSTVTSGAWDWDTNTPLPANGVAIGDSAKVDYSAVNGVVVGQGAEVRIDDATAIGQGSRVVANPGNAGSVALGQGSMVIAGDATDASLNGGIGDTHGVVSVGLSATKTSEGFTRRIINVSDGINDSDAATYGQVKAVDEKVSAFAEAGIVAGELGDGTGVKEDDVTNGIAIGEGSYVKNIGGLAIGNGATAGSNSAQTAKYATAIGTDSEATSDYSTAIGYSSKASGKNSIAIGNSIASGENNVAIGHLSELTNFHKDNTAIGAETQINADAGTAIGKGAYVSGDYGTAIGRGSDAWSDYSTALGSYAKVDNDSEYAVALGAGSVASESNTVSVGVSAADATTDNPELRRRIVNVADGTGEYDAATVGQMNELAFGTRTGSLSLKNGATSLAEGINKNTTAIKSLDDQLDNATADWGESAQNVKELTAKASAFAAQTQNVDWNALNKVDWNAVSAMSNMAAVPATMNLAAGDVQADEGGADTGAEADDAHRSPSGDPVVVEGDAHVTGNTTLDGTLDVKGEATFEKGATMKGDLNMSGNKITGLGAGDVSADSTDAVNGSQLFGVQQQVNDNRQAIGALGSRVSDLGEEVDSVGAISAALAGLHPLDYDGTGSKFQISAALGTYDGTQAAAIGGFYHFNRDMLLSIGGSTSFEGDRKTAANVGFTFRVGEGADHAKAVQDKETEQKMDAMAQEIEMLKAEIEQLKNKNK